MPDLDHPLLKGGLLWVGDVQPVGALSDARWLGIWQALSSRNQRLFNDIQAYGDLIDRVVGKASSSIKNRLARVALK